MTVSEPGVEARRTPKPSGDDAWLKKVAALPAGKQVEAVAAKLKERNPGFDGKVEPKIEGGVVTEIGVRQRRRDRHFAPCGHWPDCERSNALAAHRGRDSLSDLSPLKDMKLTALNCNSTQVSDLSPLKDMTLTYLALRRHEGVRPVAAEGHEADGPGLRLARRCPTCRR